MSGPECDYDTDAISVTSTRSSDAGVEYDVEDIVSEGWDDDGTKYLVKWAGYPLHRSNACCLQSQTLLTAW
jgi:hypothetical protein